MQQHFKSFTPQSRKAVSVLTYALHCEAEGSLSFLPWDTIDDLHEYMKNVSYVAFLDGTESILPYEIKDQIHFARDLNIPFHLFTTIDTLTPYTIGDSFFSG
eukprot:PhF_6_TR24930/c0_g2_i2/m.34318